MSCSAVEEDNDSCGFDALDLDGRYLSDLREVTAGPLSKERTHVWWAHGACAGYIPTGAGVRGQMRPQDPKAVQPLSKTRTGCEL